MKILSSQERAVIVQALVVMRDSDDDWHAGNVDLLVLEQKIRRAGHVALLPAEELLLTEEVRDGSL